MSTLVTGLIDSLWFGLEDDEGAECNELAEGVKDDKFPWARLLILADAYEEQGIIDVGRILRWCVRWSKRPLRYGVYEPEWMWCRGLWDKRDPSSNLPAVIFNRFNTDPDSNSVRFPTMREAFLALTGGV